MEDSTWARPGGTGALVYSGFVRLQTNTDEENQSENGEPQKRVQAIVLPRVRKPVTAASSLVT